MASPGVSELNLGSESGVGNEEEIGISVFRFGHLWLFFFFFLQKAHVAFTTYKERERETVQSQRLHDWEYREQWRKRTLRKFLVRACRRLLESLEERETSGGMLLGGDADSNLEILGLRSNRSSLGKVLQSSWTCRYKIQERLS